MAEKTMRVKLESARVGHRFRTVKDAKGKPVQERAGMFSQAAGDIVEMPESEATAYIERGYASPALGTK